MVANQPGWSESLRWGQNEEDLRTRGRQREITASEAFCEAGSLAVPQKIKPIVRQVHF